MSDDVHGIRDLAKFFALSGEVAEADNRPSDALCNYLDMFSIATHISNDGLLIPAMVATAWQNDAILRIHSIKGDLDRGDCGTALTSLQVAFVNRTDPNVLLARADDWGHAPFCWRGRARRLATPRFAQDDWILGSFTLRDVRYSLLVTEIALEAYRLDYGDYPTSLKQLTAEYLSPEFLAAASGPLDYLVDGNEVLVFYRKQRGDWIDQVHTVDVNWPRCDHAAGETALLSNVIILDRQDQVPIITDPVESINSSNSKAP